MDLKEAVLREHSKKQAMKIVRFVAKDPKKFKKLVSVFLEGPYRVTQRAAWPLSISVERHPALIRPYFKKILDYVRQPGIHDSVKRNTVRLLQFVDIPQRYHGAVADICFRFLQNKKEAIAIRVFSMRVIGNLAEQNPDLKKELRLIIEDHLPYATPAFVSRARKVLRDLDQ